MANAEKPLPAIIVSKSGHFMKISILIDNSPHPENDSMLTEHGLSIYFEIDGCKWMVDCGASGKFLANAEILGIDLHDVDYLLLSHAHADHTGGLGHFLQINAKATVVLSSHIKESCNYFSTRGGSKRNIGIDFSVVNENRDRFQFIGKNTRLTKNLSLITAIAHKQPQPKGNATLLNGNSPDDFLHETAFAIDTPDGAIIISSCCHHGLLNTLKASGKTVIKAYFGGTHLLDCTSTLNFETEKDIVDIARSVRKEYPEMKIITGHCTGKAAAATFKTVLEEKFHVFHTGQILDV
ncbi:MAG: hypothetical protein H6Q14_2879 [Bacteroidetes bacterium]|nr:hypothetical protein [Bacteroidota bacterium]